MIRPPVFLTDEEVRAIHAAQIEEFGGTHGIRDEGLLSSAVAAPAATFDGNYLHADIFEMAAAYAFHIAENQPFLDGNKRVALETALVFLDLNGHPVADPGGQLYDAMIAIARHELDRAGLARLLASLPRAD